MMQLIMHACARTSCIYCFQLMIIELFCVGVLGRLGRYHILATRTVRTHHGYVLLGNSKNLIPRLARTGFSMSKEWSSILQLMVSLTLASNGLAERAVQTCKAAIKKIKGTSLETKLQRFLLNYRTTPQGATGVPPCQLLMGRQLKTCCSP